MALRFHLAQALAASPMLPPGRGGLILILGGLAMLAFALFVLFVTPRSLPDGSRVSSGAAGQAAALAFGARRRFASSTPRRWHTLLCSLVAKKGLDRVELWHTDRRGCIVAVSGCQSCQRRKRQCRRERRVLLRAARRMVRSAEVREVCCRVEGKPVCAFEVDLRTR